MIEYANYENYNQLLSEGFVIVDFFSETCGPCKVLAKILEEITYELPFVNIVKVNTTAFPNYSKEYEVNAVPTLLFVVDGEIKERHLGVLREAELKEKISEYLYA